MVTYVSSSPVGDAFAMLTAMGGFLIMMIFLSLCIALLTWPVWLPEALKYLAAAREQRNLRMMMMAQMAPPAREEVPQQTIKVVHYLERADTPTDDQWRTVEQSTALTERRFRNGPR